MIFSQGVLFDLDGTLVDSRGDLHLVCNELFQKRGFPLLAFEDCSLFMGWGLKEFLLRVMDHLGIMLPSKEDFEPLFQEFCALYFENPARKSSPYEGVLELLTELQKKGAFLAVVTNKAYPIAQKVIETLFSPHSFHALYGQCEGVERKPHPQMIEMALQESKLNTDQIFYVGDSLIDLEMAKRGAVNFYAATWGYETKERLIEFGAKNILTNPHDLLQYM